MQTSNEQLAEMQQAIGLLARTLAQTETRHQRAMRRQQWFLIAIAAILATTFYLGRGGAPTAFAQSGMPTAAKPQIDPQAREAMRATLKAQLPEEQQRKLVEFEQQVQWISQYMQTWDEGQAGAVVALMLSRIGDNMDAVPEMRDEMHVMNGLMRSMPTVAGEMQRMNANIAVITANMGVMTHNMDSTMGRMGRWMPWP